MKFSISTAAFALFAAPTVLAFAPSARSSLRTSTPTPLSAYINIAEDAERNLAPFDEWATNCGVQRVEGFQLGSEDGMDWSVVTSVDLPASGAVLAVPANMIMTSSKSKADLEAISDGGVQAAVDQLSRMGAAHTIPKFYLFLQMLVEFERGEESPYFPWLDSLPRLYFNSVSMTDFCYECLPPLVFSLSRVERVKFDNFFEVLKKVDIVSDEIKQEREICKWAFNAVNTRAWGEIGQEQKLVPMGDMFNHGTETECDIAFDEEGNCQVYTTVDVPAGSPLRISYGCPTNPSKFFATYGFLDESSPATFCKMMNIQSTPELVNLGYDFSKMLFYKDTGDISEEVWDVVLYDKILKQDVVVQQQFYEAHMNADYETKSAIHQQYMLQTASEIKNHVDTFLEQLDILSAKADGKDLNEHPRLPLILRHNDFVKETFLKVKANVDPMVAQAAGEPEYA